MKISFIKPLAVITAVVSGLGFSSGSVLSADLTVALAAEPTSMDPHYQNTTQNNSLMTQMYSALVLQDVNQKLVHRARKVLETNQRYYLGISPETKC